MLCVLFCVRLSEHTDLFSFYLFFSCHCLKLQYAGETVGGVVLFTIILDSENVPNTNKYTVNINFIRTVLFILSIFWIELNSHVHFNTVSLEFLKNFYYMCQILKCLRFIFKLLIPIMSHFRFNVCLSVKKQN